jgi:hypothetical protein
MLSSAGAQTRAPMRDPEVPAPVPPSVPEPEAVSALPSITAEPAAAASVSTLPAARQNRAEDSAPRTLRLRPETAAQLRAAWLEAKRDDVLLTAQDFASNLVDEALARLRRRRAAGSS